MYKLAGLNFLTAAVNRGNERVLIEGGNRSNECVRSRERESAWTRAKTSDTNILELFLFVPSFLFLPLVWNWN